MRKSTEQCKICGSISEFVFKKTILLQYEVQYFKCSNCGFVQTEKPYWLMEAYQYSLSPLDTGLISRPIAFALVTDNLIMRYFNPNDKFLDYGGANGVFVRLMRDRGFQFYRQDKYNVNLYAQNFDLHDLPENERTFSLITCFEVLEHIENPLIALAEMFSMSDNVFCSTRLQTLSNIDELQEWDYLGELHGQHICFYTKKSMEIIASKFGCYYYSNVDLHLFTSKKIVNFTLVSALNDKLPYKIKNKLIDYINWTYHFLFKRQIPIHPESMTIKDLEMAKLKILKSRK